MSDAPEHGWLVHKAGRGWYRPKACGYTSSTVEAGRFSYKDAMKYSHPNGPSGPRDGITIKHESKVDDCVQSSRIQLFTEEQLAKATVRANRIEAALAVAEEALRLSAASHRVIAGMDLIGASAVAYNAARDAESALAKIAASKGGA